MDTIYLIITICASLLGFMWIFGLAPFNKQTAEKDYGTCTSCGHNNVSLYTYKGVQRCWECDEKIMEEK